MNAQPESTNWLIRQANQITEAHYDYSSLEIDLLVLFIQTVNKDGQDNDFYQFKFDLKVLEDRIGNSNENRRRIKRAVGGLQRKIFEFKPLDLSWISAPLISDVKITKDAYIYFCIGPFIKPLLFNLQSRYTSYQLESVLKLKGKYAKRLYQMARQWLNAGDWIANVDDLRKRLRCEDKLINFGMFMHRAIKPAMAEINEHTEIRLSLQKNISSRGSKAVAALHFYVDSEDINETIKKNQRLFDRLTEKFHLAPWQANNIFLEMKPSEISPILFEINQLVQNGDVKNIGAYTAKIFQSKGVTLTTKSEKKAS